MYETSTIIAIAAAVIAVAFALSAMLSKTVRTAIHGVTEAVGWVVNVGLWCWPLILWGIGRLTPSQGALVTGFAIPDGVVRGQNIMILLGALGLVVSLLSTMYTDDKKKLIGNVTASAIWAIGFDVFASYKLGGGTLAYYDLWPALYSTFELLAGIFVGVIAAWNKNPTQLSRAAA